MFSASGQALRKRIGGIYGRALRSTILKVTAASGVMGVVIAATSRVITSLLGEAWHTYVIDLMVSIPIGLAVFYAVTRALRVEELELAINALAGPLARRFGRRA